MAVAQYYHGFELFITLTSNPNWPKIKNKLLPAQSPADHPDLVVRVFHLYQNLLITDLMDQNIFGDTVAQVHSIEFQKCGLPHMHLLLCLLPQFWPLDSEQVNTIISATWPDPEHHPWLFEIVHHCMVHGPYGPHNPCGPCMQDG
jgi:hypothetical protein